MAVRTVFGVLILLGLLVAAPARAATINVTTTTDELTAGDGQCSLREAISTVDGIGKGDCTAADSGANTIVLGARTYPLTLAAFLIGKGGAGCPSTAVSDSTDNSVDELSVAGTVQNLTIEGAGPGQTVVDACKIGDRALEVKSGASVTLRGLSITNGHAREGAGGTNSGTFEGTGGGGIPGSNGGGILNEGTLTLIDTAVTDNHAGDGGNGGQGGPLGGSGGSGGNGGQGGGIFSTGTLVVRDSTISGNSAGNGGRGGVGTRGSTANMLTGNGGSGGSGANGGGGGGVAIEGGSATITGSTIEGNTTGAGGAAQAGEESDESQGNGGNGGSGGSGGNGGGIATAGVSVSLQATNDTVTGNVTADGANGQNAGTGAGGEDGQPGDGGNGGYGAGLLNIHSTVGLTNLTIAGNSTGKGGSGGAATNTHPAGAKGEDGHGGGIYATLSSPTLQNTILNDNEPGGECRGEITDGGHNLAFAPPTLGPLPPPDACVLTNFTKADPLLAPLADNGGPTQTMRPQPGSPAIDQAPASGAGCPQIDQRGVTRPSGAACDIGAYEVAPPQATTEPARELDPVAATLPATVTANAADATVHFEYGTGVSYGTSTVDQHVAGVTGEPVLARVTGLRPGATYHYRVVASSIDGTTDGADRTFSAPALTIRGLKVRPKRVHRKRGAEVSYVDSAPSRTQFVLSRCTKFAKKRCKHYRRVRSFTRQDVAGPNSFHLRAKHLRHGRYRLAATPSFDGVAGAPVKVAFTIVQ
jgi:CSLREA domain-containing protein